MLNRRLGLLALILSFIIIVCYTLGGSRSHVILIPTPGADHKPNQAGPAGHHGAVGGHQHLHDTPGEAAQPAAEAKQENAAPVKKPEAASPPPPAEPEVKEPSKGAGPDIPPPSIPPSPAVDEAKWGHTASSSPGSPKIEFVVSSTKDTNTSWVADFFPSVPAHVYIADDPKAAYTVRKNIGHESSVYLTYIIDHYDKLPDIVVFLHGKRYQWHNEDPLYGEFTDLNHLLSWTMPPNISPSLE